MRHWGTYRAPPGARVAFNRAIALNPAAEIAHEEDALAWLNLNDDEEAAPAAEDTGTLVSPAKAYDPNDPMAWLQSSGIDFDDSAEAVKPSLFEDNEPTALLAKKTIHLKKLSIFFKTHKF